MNLLGMWHGEPDRRLQSGDEGKADPFLEYGGAQWPGS